MHQSYDYGWNLYVRGKQIHSIFIPVVKIVITLIQEFKVIKNEENELYMKSPTSISIEPKYFNRIPMGQTHYLAKIVTIAGKTEDVLTTSNTKRAHSGRIRSV